MILITATTGLSGRFVVRELQQRGLSDRPQAAGQHEPVRAGQPGFYFQTWRYDDR